MTMMVRIVVRLVLMSCSVMVPGFLLMFVMYLMLLNRFLSKVWECVFVELF